MKFTVLLLVLLGYSQLNGQIHILVSTNPLSESNTVIPGSFNTFNSNHIFNSLEASQEHIKNDHTNEEPYLINEDITVHIREGVYHDNNISWQPYSSNPNHLMKIINYNNEKVVFDGIIGDETRAPAAFLTLEKKGGRTNFWIEGLIIQNYVNGIRLGRSEKDTSVKPGVGSNDFPVIPDLQTSHNTIKNNVFRQIGDKFTSNPDQTGFYAVQINNTDFTTIESNIFYQIENDDGKESLIHAVYLVNYSQYNLIKNNYITLSSGSPLNIRNAVNDNTFENNYIDQSGINAFITEFYRFGNGFTYNEEKSFNNNVHNNTCTFPYTQNGDAIENLFASLIDDGIDINQVFMIDASKPNFMIGSKPECEEIGAMTSADIDGDGLDELYVAFNYQNFTKLVKSEKKGLPYLSKVIYKSEYWHINALNINDFNGDGELELMTVFNERTNNTNSTEVWKGDGVNSATNNGRVYHNQWWRTAALTSGDYNADNQNVVFVAFNAPDNSGIDNTQIWKGDGINSITNYGKKYSHPWWQVGAMTSGDYNADNQNEIFVAFNAPDNSGSDNTQIWKGDGINSVTNLGKKYSHSWWKTRSLSSGSQNLNLNDEIFVAFNSPDGTGIEKTQIWKGNGLNSLTNFGKKYFSNFWKTGGIKFGEFDSSSNNKELGISLFLPDKSQTYIYGTTTNSIFNLGEYHRTDNANPCNITGRIAIHNKSTLNVSEPFLNETISIYPNPANKLNGFTISGITENSNVEIYSSTGRLINSYIAEKEKDINIKIFIVDLYFIKIINSSGRTITKRVLIK